MTTIQVNVYQPVRKWIEKDEKISKRDLKDDSLNGLNLQFTVVKFFCLKLIWGHSGDLIDLVNEFSEFFSFVNIYPLFCIKGVKNKNSQDLTIN